MLFLSPPPFFFSFPLLPTSFPVFSLFFLLVLPFSHPPLPALFSPSPVILGSPTQERGQV
ncbi:rCG31302 [Rattus norvegicus]|uniref:RCG31302 n=1 Tax=Rattus norvegicus TaxID=10116 RepID=A6ISP7_RAT|nr:rCG31302 [Rattus norvegicus]